LSFVAREGAESNCSTKIVGNDFWTPEGWRTARSAWTRRRISHRFARNECPPSGEHFSFLAG
jgi:hypothetical protein